MSTPERDLIVGGQAVIEGVMMRTPNAYAIAVRKADGTIVNTAARLPKWSDKYPLLKLPVLRGGAVLVQSMGLGIKALNYSANEAFAEAEEAEVKEVKVALSPAVIEGEGDFAGLTGAVPGLIPVPTQRAAQGRTQERNHRRCCRFDHLCVDLQRAAFRCGSAAAHQRAVYRGRLGDGSRSGSQHAPAARRVTLAVTTEPADKAWYSEAWSTVRIYLHPVRPSVAFNLIDGLIRMTFFLIMIFSFSLLKDIRRVFQYHGAEHKTVFTWEAGLPLTVDNARPQPRQHPRCGTSFLMVVMIVAIVLFSVIKFDSLLLNFAIRIALMPVVAGLSYEIIRLSAKKESSWIFKVMTRPGVWLQNITTQEPDDKQLEVAIEALKESLKLEPQTGEPLPAPLS